MTNNYLSFNVGIIAALIKINIGIDLLEMILVGNDDCYDEILNKYIYYIYILKKIPKIRKKYVSFNFLTNQMF